MIEKLKETQMESQRYKIVQKLNEVIDVVNDIQKEREAEQFEIQEWIGILEAVRKSVNVHEKQIDELQMKAEPQKCETRAENVQEDTKSRQENVLKQIRRDDNEVQRYGAVARGFKSLRKEPTDPYAEQRKWIGKLCRFWDEKEEENVFGILTTIDSDCGLSDMCPYWNDTTKNWSEHCEPVKDDIIYKGGNND